MKVGAVYIAGFWLREREVIGGPNKCSGARGFGPVAHSMSGSSGSGATPTVGVGRSLNRSERTLCLEKLFLRGEPGGCGMECGKLYWNTPKVMSSSPKGDGDPTGMRTRNPLLIPRFTVTS
jgi:hypothetical protein